MSKAFQNLSHYNSDLSEIRLYALSKCLYYKFLLYRSLAPIISSTIPTQNIQWKTKHHSQITLLMTIKT